MVIKHSRSMKYALELLKSLDNDQAKNTSAVLNSVPKNWRQFQNPPTILHRKMSFRSNFCLFLIYNSFSVLCDTYKMCEKKMQYPLLNHSINHNKYYNILLVLLHTQKNNQYKSK